VRVSLLDFRTHTRRYQLDVASGEVSFQDFSVFPRSTGRDLAAQIRVGLWSRATEFFAFCILGERIFLYCGRRSFELADRSTKVKRSGIAPFVKKFSVSQDGKPIVSWIYWFTDLIEDGFNARDFLSYIAREIAPEANHTRFIRYWEEAATGRAPARASFQEDLRKILQSRRPCGAMDTASQKSPASWVRTPAVCSRRYGSASGRRTVPTVLFLQQGHEKQRHTECRGPCLSPTGWV